MSTEFRIDGNAALSTAPSFDAVPAKRTAALRLADACHCASDGDAARCSDSSPDPSPRVSPEHLDRLRSMPDVRQAKIARIKEQLQQGDYDSEAILAKAIERMLDEMDG